MLICIETHRTSDFPGGRRDPFRGASIPFQGASGPFQVDILTLYPPSISASGPHYPTLTVTLMIDSYSIFKNLADITRWLFPY